MKLLFIPILAMITLGTSAQEGGALNGYIQEAFNNNQGLRGEQLQLEKSMFALREARALFLPNISLGASYQKADGGRTIDLPLGDLLNPVYKSLNQLTSSTAFPKLQNQSVLLSPDNYYDAHFRTTLPLINSEIYYNEKIKKENISRQRAAVNVYKRELVKEIKIAYYRYYQATKSVEIYNNALNLVNENIRVNQSLLKNGLRNSTALTRSETEKQKIEAEITQSTGAQKNVMAYINFLLNRSLESPIQLDTASFVTESQSLAVMVNKNTDGREELQELQSAIQQNELNKKLQASYLVPKLNTFLDLGSQGFNFQYDNKTQYYIWGLSLEMNLFAGGMHKARIQQASVDKEHAEASYNETAAQMQMQMVQSTNNLQTAISDYRNAKTQLTLAEKYYSDQLKVYKAGQLLYIELLDALTQLTNARLQLAISIANVQVAYADTERSAASYPLTK
ncbi:MAG TPA: TolC family protein [Puia sp.]